MQFGHLEKVAVEEPDWVFAPEGAVGLSPAFRRCLVLASVYGPKGAAVWTFSCASSKRPMGEQKTAQGFSPGNDTHKEIALKGRPNGIENAQTAGQARSAWDDEEISRPSGTIEPILA